jgi:hypothetical protein
MIAKGKEARGQGKGQGGKEGRRLESLESLESKAEPPNETGVQANEPRDQRRLLEHARLESTRG